MLGAQRCLGPLSILPDTTTGAPARANMRDASGFCRARSRHHFGEGKDKTDEHTCKHYCSFPLQIPSEMAKKWLSWKDLKVQINSQVSFTSGHHGRLSRTVMLLDEGGHFRISISYIECPFPLFSIMKQR